jgi:adenylate cyclase|tara:strand:- start:2492 stop:4270 length:1779 start_codon:yes stop_codon:yes gene_type:complete
MSKWLIGAVTVAVLSLPLIFDYKALEVLRLKTFDALVQEQTPSGHFVILDITENDISKEGGWPFPRQRLAEIQTDLLDRGALGVGWVIMFPQADRFGGDAEFAMSLQQGTNVLAIPEYENRIYPSTDGTVVLGDNPVDMITLSGHLANVNQLEEAAYQGIVSAPTDVDNLVRRVPLIVQTPKGWVASFATQVLKVLTGEGTYQIKTYESGIQAVRIPALGVIPTDKYGRKWISWVDTPKTTLQDPQVEGKFVFIGVTAAGVMPQIATPDGLLNPHHVQAALAESLLLPNSPQIPADRLVYELLIFLVLCTLGLLLGRKCTYAYMALGAAGLLVSTAGLEWYLVSQKALLIDTTYSGISLLLILGQQFWLNFREQSLLRQQIKKQFEHYLDPRQVKRLQDDPDILKLGGEKKEATFLFTDVRGFTSMSEKLEPEQVTYVMNKALTAQQEAVQKHGGMVDKYIGDAMMAIFNAPLDIPSHAKAACDCAHDIVKNMKELNNELQVEGLPPIAIGIGVNTGEAVIGNMGSESRFDYTAIGDAVNCGARLESATKEAGKDILIGERTESLCGYYLQELDPMPVKGKAKPLRVFTFME